MGLKFLFPELFFHERNSEKNFGQMKGGFEPATLESQVEHSTTEPKPLLSRVRVRYTRFIHWAYLVQLQCQCTFTLYIYVLYPVKHKIRLTIVYLKALFWVKSLNMQKSNFTVLAIFSKQNQISKCGEMHCIQRKICYQNSNKKNNRFFDPLTMAYVLKFEFPMYIYLVWILCKKVLI